MAAVAGAAIAARGAPKLPPITADQLVAGVIRVMANPGPVSGVVRTHVNLGLPSLPGQAGQPDDPTVRAIDAVNGDHRVHVWRSMDGLRLAELLPAAELGLVIRRSPRIAEAWAWDSVTFTAYRLGPVSMEPGPPAHPGELLDPATLARLSLEALSPNTRVAVGESTRVAGRDAYRLVIEPRTGDTLVGRAEVSVDAERRVPLGVSVFARGASSPALSAAFESVGFGPIDPSTFVFRPPPKATVISLPSPAWKHDLPLPRSAGSTQEARSAGVRVFGAGWETVVAFRIAPSPAEGHEEEFDLRSILPLSGSLFSVRQFDRGGQSWMLIGAVPQSRLAVLERALP